MNEELLREEIIAKAKTCIGTPFHDNACKPGAGFDCAMFLIWVYKQVGLVPSDFNPVKYSSQWALNKSEEQFMNTILALGGVPINFPKKGDIVLYKHGRAYSHGGIIIDDKYLIHAYQVWGCVSITERDDIYLAKFPNGQNRPVKYFSVVK